MKHAYWSLEIFQPGRYWTSSPLKRRIVSYDDGVAYALEVGFDPKDQYDEKSVPRPEHWRVVSQTMIYGD